MKQAAMRHITYLPSLKARRAGQAAVAALATLALAGGVASSDAQASRPAGGVIVSDDCTGTPYSSAGDLADVWCPAAPPVYEES